MKKKRLLMAFISILILSKSSLAYIDPGTGSAMLGSVWPVLVGILSAIGAFLIKYFWDPIKSFFSRIFKGKESKEKDNDE